MARGGNLTINTDHGIKTIQTWAHPVVYPSTHTDNIAEVRHSSTLVTLLDADEVRRFIAVCWTPGSTCRLWRHNACWGAGQHLAGGAPPLSCVGCQLRQRLNESEGDQTRAVPVRERGPWLFAFVATIGISAFLWANTHAAGIICDRERQKTRAAIVEAQEWKRRAQTAERDREALRREKHPATFRRQASAGAKRVYRVKKGRKR